jgi:hypothetical protein
MGQKIALNLLDYMDVVLMECSDEVISHETRARTHAHAHAHTHTHTYIWELRESIVSDSIMTSPLFLDWPPNTRTYCNSSGQK